MGVRCGSCEHANPRGARFCGRCGAGLAAVVPSPTTHGDRGRSAHVRRAMAGVARVRRRVRAVPVVVLVLGVVVVVAGLRAEPRADLVNAPTAAPPRPSETTAPLPALASCDAAPPPCADTRTDGALASPATWPILRADEHRLTAFGRDGGTLWGVSLTGDASTSPGPGGVVVGEPGGRVRLLDGATGRVLWTVDLPYGDEWIVSVAGDDRTVAVLGAPSTDGAPRVVRVSGLAPEDGTVRWSHLAMTRSSRPTAAVVGDVIVLTDLLGEGVLSAIDATTGLLRWQTEIGAPLRARGGAGRVVAAVDERLVVLDAASGQRTADVRAPARITALVEVTPTAATMLTVTGPLTVTLPPAG